MNDGEVGDGAAPVGECWEVDDAADDSVAPG